MTLAKRIIPCLDVTGGRVVKGINFVELRDAGDPVEQARVYDAAGADELLLIAGFLRRPPPELRVVALEDLRACSAGDLGGVVAAIVGDHNDAINGAQLGADGRDRGADAFLFVMRRDDDGDAPARADRGRGACGRGPARLRVRAGTRAGGWIGART